VFSLGSLGGDVRFAFTDRHGGDSAPPYDELNLSLDVGDVPEVVERNRRRVLEHLGVDGVEHASWLRAQHRDGVHLVTAPGGVHEVDGLVTTMPGVALVGLSADCSLVVLADSVAGVLGVAHCGRPGLVIGIVGAVVAAMRAAGADVIRAAVGPTVCGSCYEVPAEMAAAVVAVAPAARSRARSGAAGLDIRAGVLDQLTSAGVHVVRQVGWCTVEDPSLYSYRREHVTGRMGVLVWRPS
jgi:YfiH family protein